EQEFPVRVMKRYAWSHSVTRDPLPEKAFHNSDPDVPFIIHLGEGTDTTSRDTIFELDRRGMLTERTVIVHAVGLDDRGHELLNQRGAAWIWCPESNLFTLGETVTTARVMDSPRVALGSDSSLTAGDLLDQVKLAVGRGVKSDLIFELVTSKCAEVLR